MPVYVDSHAHLYYERFDADREQVLARARAAGFAHIINIGTDPTTTRAAIDLALQHPGFCFATVGLHPTDAGLEAGRLTEVVAELEALARAHPREVCGVGEIGLDYYWDRATPADQRRAFLAQLALAARLELPVVIHCREAMADTFAIIEEHAGTVRGVFHCFGGSAADAERAVALGWHVSFAGNLTYPKAVELREAARVVPTERLLLETDAPFLAPQPVRGQRNEPIHALHTLATLAGLHGLSADEMATITTAGARALFRLPGALPGTGTAS